LDGHIRALEHFGGVPSRIRYDNLKTAVAKVLKGRGRVESARFVAIVVEEVVTQVHVA